VDFQAGRSLWNDALAKAILVRNSFSDSPLEVIVLPKYLRSVACWISSPPSWIPMGELPIDIALSLGRLWGVFHFTKLMLIYFL